MVKKQTRNARAVEPPQMDNMQKIDGIGPAIERRLRSIGIYTFAQLAALSPADIAASVADIAGLTTERIIKQDWIGQAHQLASELHEKSMQAEATRQEDKPVTPDALVVEEEIAVPEAEPVPEIILVKQVPVKRALTGTLALRDLELIPSHLSGHRSIMPANLPFKLRVTLDLRQVETVPDIRLAYIATIYGRQLGAHQRQKLGEAQDSISAKDEMAIEVEGIVSSPGFYRLEVAVVLCHENTSVPGLIAVIQGGPLHFY